MSARASVSVQQGDKIKTIYVHGDGDIQSLGATLLKHYNDQGRADALVSLNSVFGREIGDFDTQAREYINWGAALINEWQEYNYLFDGSNWFCDSGNGIEILDNKLCGITEKYSLDTLIEKLEFHTNAITDLAIKHLKNDGLTESESQLLCILNRLHDLCHYINGITESDLKGN